MLTCKLCGREIPFSGAYLINRGLLVGGFSHLLLRVEEVSCPEAFDLALCGKPCAVAYYGTELERVESIGAPPSRELKP